MILSILLFFSIKGLGTEKFTVYYKDGNKKEAEIALSYLEKYYSHSDKITGNEVPHLVVMIEDIGTLSNGYADPIAPGVHLFTNVPYPDFHFGTMRSWWRTVSLHEYTHISHMTNVGGIPSFLRYIFGKIFLPNVFHPLYMVEGVTVFTESSIIPYEGRLNEGYYDAYKNLLAKENKLPSLPYLKHLPVDYPGYGLGYLIGGEFTEFLSGDSALARSEFYKTQQNSKKFKLNRYYTAFGKSLINALIIDFAAPSVFGKSKTALYKQWVKEEKTVKYRRIKGKKLLKGYSLGFLEKDSKGIYVYRHNVKPLSFDYVENYGEVVFMDLTTGKKRTIVKGNVVLPVKKDRNSLYVALLDIKKGGKDYSYSGFRFVSSIFKITGNKKKKLLTDEIKAFTVKDGILYYSKKKGSGSVIYKNREEFYSFDSLLVQDMDIDKFNNIYFIGYREGDGNNIYILTSNKEVKQITDQDFTFSGLTLDGSNLYFSANYKGRWQPYRYDINTGNFYILNSDELAAYPVRKDNKLYYVTLKTDGEILKEVNYMEKPIGWNEPRNKIPPVNIVHYRKKGLFDDIATLLWPDLILPYFIPEIDTFPQMYGFIITGHDALGVHSYSAFLNNDSLLTYNIDYQYGGIPYTYFSVRVNNDINRTGFMLNYALFERNIGFFRYTGIGSGVYPFGDDAVRINPQLNMVMKPSENSLLLFYAGGGLSLQDNSYGIGTGLSYYAPVKFAVLVPEVQFSQSPSGVTAFLSSGDSVSGNYALRTDFRITMPLFVVNKGISLVHFFLERFYFSIEAETGIAENSFAYDALAYISAKMSIISASFKISPSIGAGYSPDAGIFPVFGLGASLSPISDRMEFNYNLGKIIKKFDWRVIGELD